MPLVGFRPTVARLVIEDIKESVLVMKVVVDPDDAVDLTAGGTLQDLQGVLRIRERRSIANPDAPIGSLVYVAGSEGLEGTGAGKFQVNVTMTVEKFAMLLRVASAGRLPTKFFVDTGNRAAAGETPGLGYRIRSGHRTKIWDNHAHRALAIANFVMILPIEVPAAGSGAALEASASAGASDARIADLAEEMLVFQSDTRNSMFGLVCVLAVVAVAALVIALVLLFR
jgi:hypothetical protein